MDIISKALVVDNDPHEGIVIVEALSALGVTSIFFREVGNPENGKLIGVRMVIIDFMLENQSVDDAVVTVQKRLAELISPKNGPFLVLGWTKLEEDLATEFVTKFNKTSNIHNYIFEKFILKGDFIDGDTIRMSELVDYVKDCAQIPDPLRFVFEWEKGATDASNNTVQLITSIAEIGMEFNIGKDGIPDREKWRESLYHLFMTIKTKQFGKNPCASVTSVKAVCEVLSPVLVDLVENNTKGIEDKYKEFEDSISETKSSGTPGDLQEAFIAEFSGLHNFSTSIGQYPTPRPGDVYFVDNVVLYSGEEVIQGFQPKQLIPDFFKFTEKKSHDNFEKHKTYKEILAKKAKAFVVDITPACDYVDRSMNYISRMLAGLIVPTESFAGYYEKGFQRKIGPTKNTKITELKDTSYLILNFHRVLSVNKISNREESKELLPTFRFTQPLLANIQTLFGTHALRQGILE